MKKYRAITIVFLIILLAIAFMRQSFVADMYAPELFGEAKAVIFHARTTQIGIVYAPGITLLYIGQVNDNVIICQMIQIAGARVEGEIIEGIYRAGTEIPVPCNLTKNGRNWRGWIDFRGHHRLFEMRFYDR